jgi:uncharacterized membrane protein
MSHFSEAERKEIKQTIELVESQTSGEVCVCLEKYCDADPISRAQEYFEKLNLSKTKARNGVLLYIATLDKVFAIIGDEGVHQIVGQEFWEDAKRAMKNHFQEGEMAKGIIKGVENVGIVLKKHFPKLHDDENELSDDIIFGDV